MIFLCLCGFLRVLWLPPTVQGTKNRLIIRLGECEGEWLFPFVIWPWDKLVTSPGCTPPLAQCQPGIGCHVSLSNTNIFLWSSMNPLQCFQPPSLSFLSLIYPHLNLQNCLPADQSLMSHAVDGVYLKCVPLLFRAAAPSTAANTCCSVQAKSWDTEMASLPNLSRKCPVDN